jgi:uncharacterized protein
MTSTAGRSADARTLTVDIHDLPRRPGEFKHLDLVASAPDDMAVGLIAVPSGRPIRLDLTVEAVGEGVLVSGRAETEATGQCARCLTSFDQAVDVRFQELFVYPGRESDDEEVSRIVGETIDLEPVVRDAIVLDLPLAPLCEDDCLGLCADCGANLNDDPSHNHGPTTDGRWAGLSGWVSSQAD